MEIEVKRSNRKPMVIEITNDAKVLVRAPYRMPMAEVKRFVYEKSDWIQKHVEKMLEKQQEHSGQEKLTNADIQKLAKEALDILPRKVEYYAKIIGVTYGRITIRNQKTRWGSCSTKGNLNLNCLLMLTPEDVQDYVVVHELCHRKQMNHSKQFWEEVEKVLPDYRERRMWLKEHGSAIIGRMGKK